MLTPSHDLDKMKTALDAVFEETANYFSIVCREHIRITRIDPDARRAWTESWKPITTREPPNGGWNWVDNTVKFTRKYPEYLIDMAVWAENSQLSGLALGKRSRGKGNISLYYIEGAPIENHPLKGCVFNIIHAVILEYALLLAIPKIYLIEPVEGLIPFYQKHGFVCKNKPFSRGIKYCEMEVPDYEGNML